MSRLPELERRLIEAAERFDEQALLAVDAARDVTSGSPGAADGPFSAARARWGRLGRRGRGAGALAGVLVLGAVATGSAQVAGFGPFGAVDRAATMDPGLDTAAKGAARAEVRSPEGEPGSAWLMRGYVARNGELCITGAKSGATSPGTLRCQHSDAAAQQLVGAGGIDPAAQLVSFVTVEGTAFRPRRIVAYGLVPASVPRVVVTSRGIEHVAALSPQTLAVTVDKDPEGLRAPASTKRGQAARRLLASLPATLSLRLFAVEVPVARRSLVERGGEPAAPPALLVAQGPSADPVRVEVTDLITMSGNGAYAVQAQLLERDVAPVEGAAELQRSAVPALARPRTDGDTIPARLLRELPERSAMQPQSSRRLRVSGGSGLGEVWVAPGASDFMGADKIGVLCLIATKVPLGCEAQLPRAPLPGVKAIVCGSGLDPDDRLVYGLPPTDATRARLTFETGPSKTVALADLLVVRRPRTAPRLTHITWITPTGATRRTKSGLPAKSATDVCARKPGQKEPSQIGVGMAGGKVTIGS